MALLLAVPLAGRGGAPTPIVQGPGNQTAPSMSGVYLAYLDDWDASVGAIGLADLYVKNLMSGATRRVTSGGGVYGGPDTATSLVAFRREGSIEVFDASLGVQVLSIGAAGHGRSALSANLVAWEQDVLTGSDVAWQRLAPGSAPVVLSRPGRQHAVAASGDWIAFIDDVAPATVRMVDTVSGAESVVYTAPGGSTGAPNDVALWTSDTGSPLAAILVTGANGAEIAVVDGAGTALQRLTVPGGKVNPHLIGAWVGFEDLSTGVSQVVLWDRISGQLYVPDATGKAQELHDLVAAGTDLQVVWADMRSGDFDIYLFQTSIPPPSTPYPPQPPQPPPPVRVTCADATATVLADFTVQPDGKAPWFEDRHVGHWNDPTDGQDDHAEEQAGRDDVRRNDGWHLGDTGEHDEGWHSERHWRGAGGATFPVEKATPILVCIDAIDVTAAWVGAGSKVVASPADFGMGTRSLEARLTVPAGDGRVGAVMAGRPGCSLRVRVLADPGGNANGAPDGSTCSGRGDCPPPPGGLVSKFGCGTSGGAGSAASMLLLAFAALRPARRRSRG